MRPQMTSPHGAGAIARRPAAGTAGRRLALVVLAAIALGLALSLVRAPLAHAADDQIDELAVTYTVQADGTLLVRERITLRFGASSSRHGLERWLITREPYDGTRDVIYQITDPVVTSPAQASTAVAVQRDVGEQRMPLEGLDHGRDAVMAPDPQVVALGNVVGQHHPGVRAQPGQHGQQHVALQRLRLVDDHEGVVQ